MKKFLFWGLAALTLTTACNKSEVVDQPNPQVAIGFESFVDKATKSLEEISGVDALSKFYVWGGSTNDLTNQSFATIFTRQEVSKAGSIWTYAPLRYWVQGNNYSFTALAPQSTAWTYTHNNPLPAGSTFLEYHHGTITFNVEEAEAERDLIWDDVKVSAANVVDNMAPIGFTFQHLLSRVNLKFVNAFPSSGSQIRISNVSIASAKSASLVFDNYAANVVAKDMVWTGHAGTYECTYKFGDDGSMANSGTINKEGYSTTQAFCLIPSQTSITVKFTAELITGSEVTGTWDHVCALKLDAGNMNAVFKPGYSYTLVATLNQDSIADNPLNPILFTVDAIDAWVDYGNVDYLYAVVINPSSGNQYMSQRIELAAGATMTASYSVSSAYNSAPNFSDLNQADLVYTWETSDSAVASVADGVVSGVAAGQCTIYLTIETKDGQVIGKGACEVVVS